MTTQVKFEMFLPSFCPVPLLVQHFVLVPLLEKDKREMAIKNHIYIYAPSLSLLFNTLFFVFLPSFCLRSQVPPHG